MKLEPVTTISKPDPPANNEAGHNAVIAGTGFGVATFRTKGSVATAERLSVTRTVKLKEPLVVGVPLMVPLAEPRDNPVGREPPLTDQLYGDVPPEAVSVCE